MLQPVAKSTKDMLTEFVVLVEQGKRVFSSLQKNLEGFGQDFSESVSSYLAPPLINTILHEARVIDENDMIQAPRAIMLCIILDIPINGRLYNIDDDFSEILGSGKDPAAFIQASAVALARFTLDHVRNADKDSLLNYVTNMGRGSENMGAKASMENQDHER